MGVRGFQMTGALPELAEKVTQHQLPDEKTKQNKRTVICTFTNLLWETEKCSQ